MAEAQPTTGSTAGGRLGAFVRESGYLRKWLILGVAATAFLGYRVRKALNEPARKSKEPPEGGSSQAI